MSLVKTIRTKLREFDSWRRGKSVALEVALMKLLSIGSKRQAELIPREQVKRVLLIRNNKRIGNMFFLLPLVNQVRAAYPNAEVDLMLSDPWQGALFKEAGLGQIIYSNFGAKTIPQLLKSIGQVRKNYYDHILVPYGGSSDRVMACLSKGANVLNFQGEVDRAVATHSFTSKGKFKHYALGCMELLESLGVELPEQFDGSLALAEPELAAARTELSNLLGEQVESPRLAYFRGARGAKVIADSDWNKLLAEFKEFYQQRGEQLQLIEILSPDISAPLREANATYQNGDLRKLAAFLRETPLFLCGDTGPLHLASAAGAAAVGLFTVTNVEQYGCIGPRVVNISGLENLQPEAVLKQLQLV